MLFLGCYSLYEQMHEFKTIQHKSRGTMAFVLLILFEVGYITMNFLIVSEHIYDIKEQHEEYKLLDKAGCIINPKLAKALHDFVNLTSHNPEIVEGSYYVIVTSKILQLLAAIVYGFSSLCQKKDAKKSLTYDELMNDIELVQN